MNYLLSFLLICLLIPNARGQDQASITFLRDFLGRSSKIVYMNKVEESEIRHMQEAVTPDTLRDVWGVYGFNPNDRLVLTQQERSYIQNEIKLQSDVTWTSQLFENGKVLTQATLDSLYRGSADSWTYFKEHYGSSLYRFSKPIFIRKNSLCLFYYSYICGNRCGAGKLRIFRKAGATWVPWLVAYQWES